MAHPLERIPGRQITIQGKVYAYFGGTAYLGLQSHPPFMDLFHSCVATFGMHHGSSRKSNVSISVYTQAEEHLADWVGSESCLSMSSGFLAAQLVVQTLIGRGHALFLAPHAHPALQGSGVVVSASFAELSEKIQGEIDKGGPLPVLLFDTIDISGKLYPQFEALKDLPLDKLILVGDDSHGIGIVGKDGTGCHTLLKALEPAKLLVCCSLGKGLGVQAGAVFGPKVDLDMLRETAFYGGASPSSPALMGCLLKAGDIYAQRRQKLLENYARFEDKLDCPQYFDHLRGHPTFEFREASMARALEQKGFIITHFNYPDAQGPLVGRIVLSAHHEPGDIDALANCLNDLLAQGPLSHNA